MTSEDSAPTANSARLQARIAQHHGGRRRRLVAALLFFLTLGVGAVIGVGATVIYFQRNRPRPPSPDQVGHRLTEAMREVLNLDASESTKINGIISDRMQKVADIRKRSWNEIRQQFDAMQDDVVDLVGPDRYEVWERERDKRLGEKKNLRKNSHGGYDRHSWRQRWEMRRGHGGAGHGPGEEPHP